MTFIRNLEPDRQTRVKNIHPTSVPCRYAVGVSEGIKVLQLNTYGSEDRVVSGQYSQTLQFDEATALQLYRVLQKEFGFKD